MRISEILESLRISMGVNGAQWYLADTADPHASEYVSPHYAEREFLSGFTGSAGTLLVGIETALLWTDGRYYVQAEKELKDSGITLMRSGDAGVLSLEQYIEKYFASGDTLFLDGKLISAEKGLRLKKALSSAGCKIKIGRNLTHVIWKDRPADSAEEIRVLPPELCGCDYKQKLKDLKDALAEAGAEACVLCALDEQMWLFNLRGRDIPCNPVAYAYTVVTKQKVSLYAKERAVNDELCAFARDEDITLRPYEDFYKDLTDLHFEGAVLLDPKSCNFLILRILQRNGNRTVCADSPVKAAKAVKNEKEQEWIRKVYLEDSAVLTRFLRYVKEQGAGQDELSLARRLDEMRLSLADCSDLSFSTISAFGPNAAMMHYEATEEHSDVLKEGGFYLVDSGGQYDGGTTDVTRTLAIGEVPAELKKQFTRVCAGMLALQNAVFLSGAAGRNLDILARQPVWEMAMDYKCGTGHGVGYMLNVHEGPQNIRTKLQPGQTDAELLPGMLVSDEPGVYVAGSHGVRIENILLVQHKTENSDGEFLCFEPLTWVPVDLDAIDAEALKPHEREWLNAYHAKVREKLMPLLRDPEDAAFLHRATREI